MTTATAPSWEQILVAEETTGLPWGGPDFWTQRDQITASHTTLYRLYDASGQLLYIGIAGNPGRRFEQHHHDKPWWDLVTDIRLEHFTNRPDAADAERHAIRTEHPTFNRTHRTANGAHR